MFWKGKSGVITDGALIDEILSRGVITSVLPSEKEFKKELQSGRRLRFYIGADPTSGSFHLSHAKNYLLLEEFRRLGHEVVILFGTFTARVGDPSDRESLRSKLDKETIRENVRLLRKQISPLIKLHGSNAARIVYNDEWLENLTLKDIVGLASLFTVQHMLERDMFEKRIQKGDPIFLNEFLYPLLQGYDSVALDTDVEIGGTDQTFNMLAGRTLLRKMRDKEKYVVVVNLMENPKTGELMSKSAGRGVFLNTNPDEMYGAIMALGDEMTEIVLINNTRIPLPVIERLKKELSAFELKHKAAGSVASLFFGEDASRRAREVFTATFRHKEIPTDLPELVAHAGESLGDVLTKNKIVGSKSEFKRLIENGAIVDLHTNKKINSQNFILKETTALRLGKRRFVEIVVLN